MLFILVKVSVSYSAHSGRKLLNKELLQIRADYQSFIFVDSQGQRDTTNDIYIFYGERCDFGKIKLIYINREQDLIFRTLA